jgi:hypothetical protein
MRELLSDETWRQLDQTAGSLSSRGLWKMWLGLLAGVVVLSVGVVVAQSGLLFPRLSQAWSGGSAYGYDEEAGVIYYSFDVWNRGRFAADITGVGRSGPGLELLGFPAQLVDGPTDGSACPSGSSLVSIAPAIS